MMWENYLEILTLINPDNIKWKGILFVQLMIVDNRLDQEDMLKMESFRMYFNKILDKKSKVIVSWNVFCHNKKGNINTANKQLAREVQSYVKLKI